MKTATQFDRSNLNLTDARDGLIFDLQNAAEVLATYPDNAGFLRGVAADLIESGVYNADELRAVAPSGDVWVLTAALRRSLNQKF